MGFKIPRYNDYLKGDKLLYAITACCLQGFLLFGYDQGQMSNVIGKDQFLTYFGHPGAGRKGDITGSYDLGAVGGSVLCFFIGEKTGRRNITLLGTGFLLLGTVLLSTAQNIAWLIAGRVVTGVGTGICTSTLPTLQSECSPSNKRGALSTLQGTTTILGVCTAYWVGYGTSFKKSDFEWRFVFAFQGVFALALFFQALFLPTGTPRWLVTKGRYEEAQLLISDLHNQPVDSPEVEAKFFDIKTAVEDEYKAGPFKYKELFTMGETQNFRRLSLNLMLVVMHQWSGTNFINYYLPIIFEDTMGFDSNMSSILGGSAIIVYLISSISPVFIMDRFGRRTLGIFCSIGISLCMIMCAILLSLDKQATSSAAVSFIFLYQVFYAFGFLPLPWFWGTEFNITRLRARVSAIASAFNWVNVYIIVKITPILMQNMKWRVFIIFGVLNAIWVPIIYCFFPETAGIALEDIDLMFHRGGITGGVFATRGKVVQPHAHFDLEASKNVGAELNFGENENGKPNAKKDVEFVEYANGNNSSVTSIN
ncbi:hypothetical protein WICMUC_004368 [Wickerhamomyces mucosus]|uniref:Major facilitator superfamily (MFS) profile domain-containing protein n=1 Tax=Wickerhamomyces mucosus TaxID=1378264 RepID=A0A9P8TAC3_9ASCO|nr:hypothetical protein WICMUC_004368 [Wickerhamomyces mucosus]